MLILILYFIACAIATRESPIVQISSGLIEGQYVQSNVTDKPFYSFRGIPYAEPPIGELRFQPPVKPKPWTKTLETKQDGAMCMQETGGSEDCLFLNVYTPTLPSDTKKSELLPVIVYVHGGGFVFGSSSSSYYGPDNLVDKNIVLVTMNYRLNIFGFLNALEESAPGNAGLKDLVAVLEWVQENIEKFNGDPKKVTIDGHSAGSAAVQYLLQSKLTKGLFHRAIMQSGSTLNDWALEDNPLELIHKLGALINVESKNITDIITKLKTLPKEELFNASINKAVFDRKHIFIQQRFVPCLEYDTPNAFITENSYSLLANNDINSVPIMMGYVSQEAILFVEDIKQGNPKLEDYENDPTFIVPNSLNIKNESSTCVWEDIKNHYFYNVSITNITAFLNLKSDDVFVRGIRKSLQFLRKHQDVYFYIFEYEDKNSTSEYPGVPHAGELEYMFNTGVEESEEDKKIKEKMTTLWTNFAKTGNPTPIEDPLLDNIKWPAVSKSTKGKVQYLDIGVHLNIKENPGHENFEFWERTFNKYGQKPFSKY